MHTPNRNAKSTGDGALSSVPSGLACSHWRGRSRVGWIHRGRLFPLLVLLAMLPLSAEEFVVTKTQDTSDGACDRDCSVREAIDAANQQNGLDIVIVPAGRYFLSDNLEVLDDLAVEGAGLGLTIFETVGHFAKFRTYHALDLRDLTLKGGPGRGIMAPTTELVTLERVEITECGPINSGCTAIRADGPLEIRESILSRNQGNSLLGSRGLLIVDSFFLDNGADSLIFGGWDEVVEIRGSVFIGNECLRIYSPDLGWDVHSSLFFRNRCSKFPSESIIYIRRDTLARIKNSMFIFNGRLVASTNPFGGVASFRNSTIVDNPATTVLEFIGQFPSRAYLGNTIIHGKCRGAFASYGGNVEAPGDTCNLTGPGDRPGISPDDLELRLFSEQFPFPLGEQPTGVTTPSTSIAVDGGLNDICLVSDYRGQPRPMDGDGDSEAVCDVGAFELGPGEDPGGIPLLKVFADSFESGDTTLWSRP